MTSLLCFSNRVLRLKQLVWSYCKRGWWGVSTLKAKAAAKLGLRLGELTIFISSQLLSRQINSRPWLGVYVTSCTSRTSFRQALNQTVNSSTPVLSHRVDMDAGWFAWKHPDIENPEKNQFQNQCCAEERAPPEDHQEVWKTAATSAPPWKTLKMSPSEQQNNHVYCPVQHIIRVWIHDEWEAERQTSSEVSLVLV